MIELTKRQTIKETNDRTIKETNCWDSQCFQMNLKTLPSPTPSTSVLDVFQVSAFTSPEETVCICNNPPGTSFASSFFVAPNTIDFSTVFSKFDITNASVYGTLIGLLLLWVLALLWARRKDHQDKLRVGVAVRVGVVAVWVGVACSPGHAAKTTRTNCG